MATGIYLRTKLHGQRISEGFINNRPEDNFYEIQHNRCWKWMKPLNNQGYGQISRYGERLAHRVFYRKYKGNIPKDLCVDHLCKNRWCVNPDHMELVTRGENCRRGRVAKITKEDAMVIRDLYKTGHYRQKELGLHYGIGQDQVSRIVNNWRWF